MIQTPNLIMERVGNSFDIQGAVVLAGVVVTSRAQQIVHGQPQVRFRLYQQKLFLITRAGSEGGGLDVHSIT
jgi:hypothetical protein